MKIGIIGAGNVGGNLARGLARKGHQVLLGVREPRKVAALVSECGANASAGDPEAAARFGEVVVLTLPWQAVSETLRPLAESLAGKVLVDSTNPLGFRGGPVVDVGASGAASGAEAVAALCPKARVVKAFNTLGAEHLLHPEISGVQLDMFVCGDDRAAVAQTSALAEDLGFAVVNLGPLRNARLAEHLAVTWIHLATAGGLGRNIALKVVRG